MKKTRKTRNTWRMAACMMLAFTMATGCGSGSEPHKEETKTTEASKEETTEALKQDENTEGEDITLRFIWWGGEDRNNATLEAIARFEDSHPGVKIEGEYASYEGYQTKIMTQAASGTLPDIMQLDQPWLGGITSKNDNVFLDLNNQEKLDLSVYNEEDLKAYCTFNGKLVGIPSAMNGNIFMLNNTLLKEAGIEMPEQLTWEDIITIGNKLRETGENRSFFNGAWGEYEQIFRTYMGQLCGKDFMDEETVSMNFTKEQLTEAFDYFQRMFQSGATPDPEVIALYANDPRSYPDRLNGNLAAVLTGPHDWSTQAASMPEGAELTYTTLPMISGNLENTGITWRPAQVFSIAANTKYPELCIEFLQMVGTDDETIDALGTWRGIPSSSYAQNRLVESGVLKDFLVEMQNAAQETAGKPYCWISTDSEIKAITEEMLQNVAFNEMSPEEAGEEAVRLYQKRLDAIKSEQ